MKVSKQVRFNESYLPPRCRIERYREVSLTVEAELKEVSTEQAPVAIIQYTKCPRKTIKYRWYNKRLFTRVYISHFSCLNGRKDRVASIKDLYWGDEWIGCTTKEEAVKRFENRVNNYLLINDNLYECVGEPMYCVYTFGLGCNHSSTALSVDDSYNPNIPWHRYVRCDQLAKALRLHKKIALGRGDTDSIPSKLHETFDILIPKAVRRNPKKDYGGCDDDFINGIEEIISATQNPVIAGFGVMKTALQGIA